MADSLRKDILEYLQCMVNTETPTPPKIVNDMLDLIPQSVWDDDNTRVLCPACKDGIFLRETVLRMLRAKYEKMVPDEFRKNQDEILEHILKNRIFGIAISYRGYRVTKRTLYTCNKKFADIDNIFFDESFGRYVKDKDGKETEKQCFHFIENQQQVSKFFESKGVKNMQFDVIIGNPPYQESDGGAGASAKPLYNEFITQAKKNTPNFIVMIVPSRFFTGGKGLDDFRNEMIHDKHIKVLHDYANASEVFPDVDIKGGVCYFLWDKNTEGTCKIYRHDCTGVSESDRFLVDGNDDIFIRYNEIIPIKHKIETKQEKSFETIVSPRKPYGLSGDFFKNPAKYKLPNFEDKPCKDGYAIIGLDNTKRTWKYLPKNYPIPTTTDMLHKYKIFITRNYGCGEMGEIPATPVLATPVLATPEQLCTETFIQIGPFETQKEMENCFSYIKTKFFRCLVGIRKQDQGATRSVYKFVPLQNFNESWTDEKLYKKYGLNQQEINFIETNITEFDDTKIENANATDDE